VFITYDVKDGIDYAKLCVSIRDGENINKDYADLGRVLDKERGIFTYDLASNAYDKAPVEYVHPATSSKELLVLDFGDSFFIDRFMRAKSPQPVIDAIGYGNPDTLYAMIMYYAICSAANCHAQS